MQQTYRRATIPEEHLFIRTTLGLLLYDVVKFVKKDTGDTDMCSLVSDSTKLAVI